MKILAFVSIVASAALAVSCGGSGASSPAAQTLPFISSISPSTAMAGDPAFQATIAGSNFTSGCSALWNASQRSTNYISASALTFWITAADVSSIGTNVVSVSCKGKISNSLNFAVRNRVPILTSFNPANAIAGGRLTLVVTILGSNFLPSSYALVNGSRRSSAYVSKSEMTATLLPEDAASPGAAAVTVVNPDAGGGVSNVLYFPILTRQPLSMTTHQLPEAVIDKPYQYSLQVSGGIPPYAWSADSLPQGLQFSSGQIYGTPSSANLEGLYLFRVAISDSGLIEDSLNRGFNIRVRSGSLGRNDTCALATAMTNGTIRASISPFGDVDVYSFQGAGNSIVTVETTARRLGEGNYLDSFLELLDSNCNRLAYSDDIISGSVQDSSILYTLPSDGTYYIRVSDLRGDGRPDFVYDLRLSGAN